MVWATNWYWYEPKTRRVHLQDGCAYSGPLTAQRYGFQRVGNESMATLEEAMPVARQTIDPEARPCPLCQPEVEIARPRTADDDWLDMLDEVIGRRR